MKKLFYILIVVITCSCDQNPEEKKSSEYGKLWALQVPDEIKSIAASLGLECPPEDFGCAACDYCAFVKLSSDWSLFAYEQDETKHYRKIEIYNKTSGEYKLAQTLYGYTANVIVNPVEEIYSKFLHKDTPVRFYSIIIDKDTTGSDNRNPQLYQYWNDMYNEVK